MPDKPYAAGGARRYAERMLHRITRVFSTARLCQLRSAAWGAAALCAVAASILIAPGWSGLLGGGLAVVMIAIAAIDAREFRIPDPLVVVGLLLGFAEAATAGSQQFAALASAALRGVVLAFALLAFRYAYGRIRKREGLGLGDVKLGAVAGVWLTWTAAAVAIDFAAVIALVSVLIGGLRGRRISGTTRIPFGLFFAPAIWLAWLLDMTLLRGIIRG